MSDTIDTTAWKKPGPGTWELDSSHCGPAPGPILRGIYHDCIRRGFDEGFALFGSPLKRLEMKWVNGKFYRRLVPLVGGGRDLPTPPAPVLWLAARLHPEFRRQERRAKESFETKRWRSELARWENEWKPAIIKRNVEFHDVEIASLSDADLATHLEALHEHVLETTSLHFRLHVSDMGPLGDLMVHLDDWGIDQARAFHALVAASPATRAPSLHLRRLVVALREAGVEPTEVTTLDDVRRASDAAAALLDDYLRHHGWRLTTGYDLEDRALIELPDVIVRSIVSTAHRTGDDVVNDLDDSRGQQELSELRGDVPFEHRAEFDEIVEDARLSYGLRDENGPITYEWPAGLLRRALLEAGRRLAASRRIAHDGQVFELTVPEIAGALRGAAEPTQNEIDARAAERQRWAAMTPPARLGPEEAPPPVAVLPPYLGRFTRIVLTVTATLEADRDADALTGLGIGDRAYTGTARVVHDAAEALASVEPGDVIVAPYTAPTYNAILAIAGAVVTEQGGLLCHAAVLARELELPAIVGAADAMTRIPDGATVEVDPVAGRVRVV